MTHGPWSLDKGSNARGGAGIMGDPALSGVGIRNQTGPLSRECNQTLVFLLKSRKCPQLP